MRLALAWLLGLAVAGPATARAQPLNAQPSNGRPSNAQPPNGRPSNEEADVSMVTMRARALFEQALEELREGRAAAGRDLLRRSLAILPTVATRYNLAVALRRTGEVTEAQFVLQRLLEEGLEEPERARIEAQLEAVRAQIATLVITVSGGAAAAQIEVDGVEVGQSGPRPLRVQVDPGRHRVAALEGTLRGTADAEVDAGDARPIALRLAPFADPAAEGVDPWPWVVTAIAVVAAGVAVGLGLYFTIGQTPEDPYPTARTFETLGEVRF